MSQCLYEYKGKSSLTYEELKNIILQEKQGVNYQFKSVQKIFDNLDKVKKWYSDKNIDFWNKLQKDLQIPKEQVELLKSTQENMIESIFKSLKKECN